MSNQYFISKCSIVLLFLICCFCVNVKGQEINFEMADSKSFALYEKQDWPAVISFGKEAIAAGQDFILLRLRIGYAAWMLHNYSEAIKQYDQVLLKDKYNQSARYFSWLCRINLNQPELASIHQKYFFDETISTIKKTKKNQLKTVAIESDFKSTNSINRGNGVYYRLAASAQLGWHLNMQQSIVSFQQTINEPQFVEIDRNNDIHINQKEYYNLTTYNIDHHWQIKGAYHLLYTPFNNYIYYNHIGMLGLKYFGNKANLQLSYASGLLTDTIIHQVDVTADFFPVGNLSIYATTNASLQFRNQSQQINLQQTIGCMLHPKLWVETNFTIGKFSNRLEQDLLYVYNAVDPNLTKIGLHVYYAANKNLIFQLGTINEKRTLYGSNYIFNQQTLNTGITWKF